MHPDALRLLENLKIEEELSFEVKFYLKKYYTGNMMYDFVSPRNTNVVHVMLNDDVRAMKESITGQIRNLPHVIENKDEIKKVKAYSVYVILYNSWATNKFKSLRKIDISNIWKPVEDAVMEALEVDDSKCVDLRVVKAQSNEVNDGLVEVKFQLFR